MNTLTVEDALRELREMFPRMAFHIDIWSGPLKSNNDYCNLTVLDRPPDTHVLWTETHASLTECVAQVRKWKESQQS